MQVDYDVYKQKLLQCNMKRGILKHLLCVSPVYSQSSYLLIPLAQSPTISEYFIMTIKLHVLN